MPRSNNIYKYTLLFSLSTVLLCGCSPYQTGSSQAYTRFSDIADKNIGVNTGSVQAQQAESTFPNAKFYYFSTGTDMLNALKAHKIDAFADAEIPARYMMSEEPDITVMDEKLADGMKVAGVFPKTEEGQALCDEYSDFIRQIKASGEFDEVMDIWLGSDQSKKTIPDLDTLPDTNGTLHVAVDNTMIPFVFVKDDKLVGIDMDIAYRFCKKRGYALIPVPMDFGGILPSITTGKCDFAAGGVAYTPERAESVLFSEPTYEGGSVVVVLKPEAADDEGLLSTVIESFEKTFIRESRWQLFIQGILNTIVITVLSVIFGTLLGFLVYLLCRKGNPVAVKLTGAFVWLVEGMPVVVLLMVLYYIIFGELSISGIAVSVIGFALVFGTSMYGMLQSGVNAVDKGQTEAAHALGYTDNKAFFKIILPQAAAHFMPEYKGQLISLLKATSIVGYIAVQDLTKMGDIVRSRTYEAFFPLIAVAVIYFVIAAVLVRIVSRLYDLIDFRSRTPQKILKGVKKHD